MFIIIYFLMHGAFVAVRAGDGSRGHVTGSAHICNTIHEPDSPF